MWTNVCCMHSSNYTYTISGYFQSVFGLSVNGVCMLTIYFCLCNVRGL